MIDPAFWRGKRVLVTGHTGFKGSWLSLWLSRLGAEVAGFALAADTTPSLYVLAGLDSTMDSVIGDIRDAEALRRVVARFRPEIVLHLAAQPLVRRSYREPAETLATNVLGTAHLLDAVRLAPSVRSVVVVTSDKCYENREVLWGYRETDPMGGRDPYSASKGCAELVVASYRSSFFADPDGARIASGRAGNVLGGGDWAEDRLIPDLVRGFQDRRPVLIRRPGAVRPWQHVLEPLAGYLVLAERLFHDGQVVADGWNFGPRDDDAQPVSWVADRMCQVWGGGAAWQPDDASHPHEAGMLRLDWSRARLLLGWTPRWTLATALDRTTWWYRQVSAASERALVRRLVDNDLDAYQTVME